MIKLSKYFMIIFILKNSDVVLKIPLICLIKQISNDDIKIEKFDLSKYTYLLHHK